MDLEDRWSRLPAVVCGYTLKLGGVLEISTKLVIRLRELLE